MPIQLHWENEEQTIIRYEIRSPWSWEELFKVLDEVKVLTDKSTEPLGAILDVNEGVKIPGGLFNPKTIEYANKIFKLGEGGKKGHVIVVGKSPMIKTMFNVAQGLNREAIEHFSFADTVEDARAQLAQKLHSPPI